MMKYKTERWSHDIQEAEVTKDTDLSVFLADGSRELKVTQYHQWHDSREEARSHLIGRLEANALGFERELRQTQEALARLLNEERRTSNER